ncbi:hypothetical protein Bca4012_047084 [Brassica carinata]
MERGNGGNSFSSKEEDDRKRTAFGKTSFNFFPQEMYKLVLHGGGKPVNPQSKRIDGRVKSFTLWYGESESIPKNFGSVHMKLLDLTPV